MLALFLGLAVHVSEATDAACVDLGIPPPFNSFFPSCDFICDDPMLLVAATMFCPKTCGICTPAEPVWEKSEDNCSRQEISYEMEKAIYAMMDGGDTAVSAARPCLRMRTHLSDILTTDDELVGQPDVILLCDCLNRFDDDFAKEHLNCKIAGEHMMDLQQDCKTVDKHKTDTCDWDAIQAELVAKPATASVCSNFAAGATDYGTDLFDPASICDCVDAVDPVDAARAFNCMSEVAGYHAMDLYTDICFAYKRPCDRDAIREEMKSYILSHGLTSQYEYPCRNMQAHFNRVLDPETHTLKEGTFEDFALMCQCLSAFSRAFVDKNMRCGLAGHDGYSVWNECSVSHGTKCKDMNCAHCEEVLRCSMNKDGTCWDYCPTDGTCFDDPSTGLTCDNYETEEATVPTISS